MFLNDAEIAELTGYVRPKEQRRWLTQNGYKFDNDRLGRPKVLVAQVEARQLGRKTARRTEPDFSAIKP